MMERIGHWLATPPWGRPLSAAEQRERVEAVEQRVDGLEQRVDNLEQQREEQRQAHPPTQDNEHR